MDLVEPDSGDPDTSTSPKKKEVNKTPTKLSSVLEAYLSLLEVFEIGDSSKTLRALLPEPTLSSAQIYCRRPYFHIFGCCGSPGRPSSEVPQRQQENRSLKAEER
jgi:hypothetical protein